MAITPDGHLWAVGWTSAGKYEYVIRWNGRAWTRLPTALIIVSGTPGISALSGRSAWVGVVMDMALPQVLLIDVLVGLVAVREGRVIVLVVVAGDEVGEVLAGPVVVGDVHMLVGMHNGIVLVRFSHCFLLVCESPGHHMPESDRWTRPLPG